MSFNPLSLDDIGLLLERETHVNSNFEKIVRFSGGSYEQALLLCEDGTLDLFTSLIRSLTDYICKRDILVFEVDELLKRTHAENVLSVLINMFEAMLLEVYSQELIFFNSFTIPSEKDIIKMIKILMLMHKGFVYNINFYNTLKAMMYSFDSFPTFGIPNLENALGGALL